MIIIAACLFIYFCWLTIQYIIQLNTIYCCVSESIYRRGARRWRKLYRVNGHIFQAKRYNPLAVCAFCGDRIWGLGRQGFQCINCKLMIHKKCHKLIKISCAPHQVRLFLFFNKLNNLILFFWRYCFDTRLGTRKQWKWIFNSKSIDSKWNG